MQGQKSFWKKYEFLILAVITLLFIYFVVFFNQKINFLLGNELIVSLSPEQKSFNMHYGEVSKAEFDVSIDNAAYCRASCAYSFNDRSTNDLIDNGSFEIEKGLHFTKNYELGVKRLGSGQDIYSFNAVCRSMRSFLCLTKGDEKSKSSLVIVNYDLTEAEKELKKILKQNVTRLLEMLADADVLHQQLDQKYFELGFRVNLQNLSKEKINIDDSYDRTRIQIENLRSLWAVEDYIKLNRLFSEDFFFTVDKINRSIEDLDNSVNNIVDAHNTLLSELGKLSVNLKSLNSFARAVRDNEALNLTDAGIEKFNNIASSMSNNTFKSYGDLGREAGEVKRLQDSIAEKTRIQAASLFFDSEYLVNFGNDIVCSLMQDCDGNISSESMIRNTERFFEQYPSPALLKQNCDSLKGLSGKYLNIRDETSAIIANKNITFQAGSEIREFAKSFKDNEIRKINNSYHESLEAIKSGNKTNPDVIRIAESMLPKNNTGIISLSYNQSINISLYILSQIEPNDASQALDGCSRLDEHIEGTGAFNFEPISRNITYGVISRIDTNLSDNPPICCVFNECRQCCRDDSCKNDPKTFPVIFLHGHSFAKDNSPEFSLDSFNKLQSKLQDEGYLNAGIVSLYSQNEQMQKGIWGMSGKPVTVKASYYYDAFRKEDKYIVVPTKSENIDTYAIRLRDLIKIVKERTNKPKVNIIAHSMGGLVARRYMQIFGDEDIEKLIMIATPNNGISGQASDYCGFVGENRECKDMQENSLFINKLNDPLQQPNKAKMYAIIGLGCEMKSGDGDGIVLSKNAKSENSKLFYVNGTCGGIFGGTLHTEILNIEKYPETYRIMTGILKE